MIPNRFIAETLSGAVEELEKERAKRHEQQEKCRERACRARAAREAAMKPSSSFSHPNLNAPGASK